MRIATHGRCSVVLVEDDHGRRYSHLVVEAGPIRLEWLAECCFPEVAPIAEFVSGRASALLHLVRAVAEWTHEACRHDFEAGPVVHFHGEEPWPAQPVSTVQQDSEARAFQPAWVDQLASQASGYQLASQASRYQLASQALERELAVRLVVGAQSA